MKTQNFLILLFFLANIVFIYSTKVDDIVSITASASQNYENVGKDDDNVEQQHDNMFDTQKSSADEEGMTSEVLGMFKSSDFESGVENREELTDFEQEKTEVVDVKNQTSSSDESEFSLKSTIDIMGEEPPKLESIEMLMKRKSDETRDQAAGSISTTGVPTPAVQESHLSDNLIKDETDVNSDVAGGLNETVLSSVGQDDLIKQKSDTIRLDLEKEDRPENLSSEHFDEEPNKNETSTLLETKEMDSYILSDSPKELESSSSREGVGTLSNLKQENQENYKSVDFSEFHSDIESQIENYEGSALTDDLQATKTLAKIEGSNINDSTQINRAKSAGNNAYKLTSANQTKKTREKGKTRITRRLVRRIFNKKGASLFAVEISKMKPQLKKKFLQEILKNMDFNDIEVLIGLALEEKFARSEENKIKQAIQSNIPGEPLLGKKWIEREKSKSSKE
ncbi:dentin sialophospho precursor [Cryptosporidium bovis]|uniref:dentin sialophospho precursor n=1 Tax=Cryptosporidium bovis TaxID=310047 RepID=UPI00351A7D2A|nr:dentin sialophospho precursor [Cryptosporidium bovis]